MAASFSIEARNISLKHLPDPIGKKNLTQLESNPRPFSHESTFCHHGPGKMESFECTWKFFAQF